MAFPLFFLRKFTQKVELSESLFHGAASVLFHSCLTAQLVIAPEFSANKFCLNMRPYIHFWIPVLTLWGFLWFFRSVIFSLLPSWHSELAFCATDPLTWIVWPVLWIVGSGIWIYLGFNQTWMEQQWRSTLWKAVRLLAWMPEFSTENKGKATPFQIIHWLQTMHAIL